MLTLEWQLLVIRNKICFFFKFPVLLGYSTQPSTVPYYFRENDFRSQLFGHFKLNDTFFYFFSPLSTMRYTFCSRLTASQLSSSHSTRPPGKLFSPKRNFTVCIHFHVPVSPLRTATISHPTHVPHSQLNFPIKQNCKFALNPPWRRRLARLFTLRV